MKIKITTWVVLVILAIGAYVADAALTEKVGQVIPGHARGGSQSVYANIAGQFRTVGANLLWMKVDMYHHEFLEGNPSWTDNKDLLPLFRMITWLDPHFVQAYSSCAWMLGMRHNKMGHARAFLMEGLEYNPNSSELYETLGILTWRREGNAKASIQYLEKAEKYASTAFDKEKYRKTVVKLKQLVESGEEIKTLGGG